MKKIIVCAICALSFSLVSAQKISVLDGSLSAIKGEKKFNIEYDYSDMGVGKYDREEDYVKRKVMEYNEKEPGRGDRWHEMWVNDRNDRFHDKFEQLINKYLAEKGMNVSNNHDDAKYTFILHTIFTEPGFNVGVARRPALIDVELSVVENANPDNVVLKILSRKNPGTAMWGNDYDTGQRLAESYAKCGKELGKYFIKKMK